MVDTTDGNEPPVSVRVLVPDGGELEPPEEREAEEEEPEDEATGDGETSEAEEVEREDESAEEVEVEEDSQRAAAEAEEGTRVLHLHLDRVFLDLLGLEVDLDEVTLDITAMPGEGNLLGNLLSSVSGLLDEGGLGNLLGGGDGSLLSLPSLGLPSLPELPDPKERASRLADAISERIRNAIGDAIAALPLEELFTQFFKALVDQLINGGNGNGEAQDEEATAAA